MAEKEKTIIEKINNNDDIKMVRVTKWYERRVSLKSLTHQYDNINAGNAISAVISFKDQADLDKKMSKLGKKILDETERDLARSIVNIKSLLEDKENNALVGLGANAEYDELLTQIDGFEDILEESDGVKIPHGFIEDDF